MDAADLGAWGDMLRSASDAIRNPDAYNPSERANIAHALDVEARRIEEEEAYHVELEGDSLDEN